MPWANNPDDRRRSDATYKDPEYLRNRAAARRRAGGRCEDCGHRHRTQCDHDTPVSKGGTHDLANLVMRCVGDGSCKCHERKTANEGGGYRSKKRTVDPAAQPRTKW